MTFREDEDEHYDVQKVKFKTKKLKNGLTRVTAEPGIKLGDWMAMMKEDVAERDKKKK
jgi:hypothetical protein